MINWLSEQLYRAFQATFILLFILLQFFSDFMNSLWFGPLDRECFEEMLDVTVEANRHANPLIVKKIKSLQQFREETSQVIQEYYELQEKQNARSGRNGRRFYGAKLDGRLVAVVFSLDLLHRYQLAKKTAEDEKDPARQFFQLFASLELQSLKAGVASYHARISVLPAISKKGLASRLHYQLCKYELHQGYQFSIQGTMHEVSSNLLLKMGSQEVRSMQGVLASQVIRYRLFRTNHKKVVEIYEKKHQGKL